MSDLPPEDMLAQVTAMIDQAQALIDESRSMFPNDDAYQRELDVRDIQLKLQRERVELLRFINDTLES